MLYVNDVGDYRDVLVDHRQQPWNGQGVRTEERLAPNLLENLITWYRFVPNLNKLKQTLLLTVHICINPELEIATTT